MARKIERVLITGAAGRLGTTLREQLRGEYGLIRLSDVREMPAAGQGEEVVVADLADAAAVEAMCRGIDAVVHMGGNPSESPWEEVLKPNIIGCYNLFEGARRAGVDRVIFASSNHAIGMYRRSQTIGPDVPARPDTRYGLSKAFGEDLASLYAYKWGVRGFCLRIGSATPRPMNRRSLSTWLSYEDLARLVRVGLSADYVFEIAYGVSANKRLFWDNSRIHALGYQPQDNAEDYAAEIESVFSGDPVDEAFQGGPFVSSDFSADPDKVP